jgi:hypothetical protein
MESRTSINKGKHKILITLWIVPMNDKFMDIMDIILKGNVIIASLMEFSKNLTILLL